MKPIQIKKIRHCKSSNMLPKQLETKQPWKVLDLSKPNLSNGSGDLLVTERFHSVPFQLFVQGNLRPMKEVDEDEEIIHDDFDLAGNMTQRFMVRGIQPMNTGKHLLHSTHSCAKIFTIQEEDEDCRDILIE